jgi:exodeoxyribonuclease V beta subunit
MQPLNVPAMALDGMRLIEASAGTGKTHAIANLYLRVLLTHRHAGAPLGVRQLLVVTFTRAATEELRDRIRARLQDAVDHLEGQPVELDDDCTTILAALPADARADARRRLRAAIAGIDEAAIFTIHSFCQRALRDHAFESGQPFDVELLSDDSELVEEVVADCFRVHLYGNPALARCLFARGIATPEKLAELVRPLLDGSVRLASNSGGMEHEEFVALVEKLKTTWTKKRDALIQTVMTFTGWTRKPNAGWIEGAAARLDAWAAGDDLALDDVKWFNADELAARTRDDFLKNKDAPANQPFMRDFARLAPALGALEARFIERAMHWCRAQLRARKDEHAVASFGDLIERLREAIDDTRSGARLVAKIGTQYPVALIDEFQDTDPAQYRVFQRIYGEDASRALLMIGDPKQAIYSFRGADIHAYLDAKARTGAQAQYTMSTNWRSTQALVTAVNTLFGNSHDPFLFGERIAFEEVKASGNAEKKPLRISGEEDRAQPFRFWLVRRGEDAGNGLVPANSWYDAVDAAVAGEIAQLLTLAAAGKATVGDKPLQPRDIAALVRTHREGQRLQEALRVRGVGAAVTSRDSVYGTDEAADLLVVLTAMTSPGNDGLLRRAMATPLWGLDAAALATLIDDESRWDLALERARRCHQRWLALGFMPMFRLWLHEESIAPRLLAQAGGDRVLTNLLHLAELVQTASAAYPAPEALCRWLATAIHEGGDDNEEQQLRLESDENLVQIVTLHKSKGLQYPVVFLPTLARMTADLGKLNRFHDAGSGNALTYELRSQGTHRNAHDAERLQEDLRLVYVALTRAIHRCYLPWGALYGAPGSGLHWLLHAGEGSQPDKAFADTLAKATDEQIRTLLQALQRAQPEAFLVEDLPDGKARFQPPPVDATRFAAQLPQRLVTSAWKAMSFSGLAAGHEPRYRHGERGSDAEDADDDLKAGGRTAARDMAGFVRGRDAGHVLHGILENLPLDADVQALEMEARVQLVRRGISVDWAGVIATHLHAALRTPVNESGLRLCELGDRRIAELEFQFRLGNFCARDLAAALDGRLDAELLSDEHVAGLMRGAIDLVFEHGGRWYIADWKSNRLGDTPAAYTPSAIENAIAQNRYELQYLIYTVALHRLLRRRLGSAYDYDTHFGGVFYFFLRGMTPAGGCGQGIFRDCPSRALIETLDKLFDAEGTA